MNRKMHSDMLYREIKRVLKENGVCVCAATPWEGWLPENDKVYHSSWLTAAAGFSILSGFSLRDILELMWGSPSRESRHEFHGPNGEGRDWVAERKCRQIWGRFVREVMGA